MMGIFIVRPWLALIPAVLFLALYRVSGKKLAALMAYTWLLYALYEYAMRRRWLCSGECDIRVDLLLLYPILVFASLAGLVVAVRALLAQKRGGR
jgi:hypothetical protein